VLTTQLAITCVSAQTLVATLTLDPGVGVLQSSVVDHTNGFLYLESSNTRIASLNGRIVRIRLSDFADAGALTLNEGETPGAFAAIDEVHDFAYFGGSPIVKIRLSDFTRVGEFDLGIGPPNDGLVDQGGEYAYFVGLPHPTRIMKVRLLDFTVTSLSLNYDDMVTAKVIDSQNGFGYFGIAENQNTVAGRVLKVRLSDFALVDTLVLDAPADMVTAEVIDPDSGFGYFGIGTPPDVGGAARVLKVRLSDLVVIDTLVLDTPLDLYNLSNGVIDNGFAYFKATSPEGDCIVKIRLSDFTRIGILSMPPDCCTRMILFDPANGLEYYVTRYNAVAKFDLRNSVLLGELSTPYTSTPYAVTVAIDSVDGYAYLGFSGDYVPSLVVKIDLSAFRVAATLTLNPGEYRLVTAAIDTVNGFAYFVARGGSGGGPGVVVKVRLSDFTRVGALILASDISVDDMTQSIIDSVAGYMYLMTYAQFFVKIRLSDFAVVETKPLWDFSSSTVVADLANGYAYFGTDAGQIVKVRLSDLAEVGTLTPAPSSPVVASAMDPANGYAYFATRGTIVKVDLANFTFGKTLILKLGDTIQSGAVIIDASNDFVYFLLQSTNLEPTRVLKIGLSDLTEVAAVELVKFTAGISFAVLDPNGFLYLATEHSTLLKVRLSDFAFVGTLCLDPANTAPGPAVVDTVNGFAYFGIGVFPGHRIAKMSLTASPTTTPVPEFPSLLLFAAVFTIATAVIGSRRRPNCSTYQRN